MEVNSGGLRLYLSLITEMFFIVMVINYTSESMKNKQTKKTLCASSHVIFLL